MNLGLYAGVLLASWLVIAGVTWWWLQRPETYFDEPGIEEANRAIVDSVKASLYERPDQWKITDQGLMHAAGTEIVTVDNQVAIVHGGAQSIVVGPLMYELIRAVQVRNAKMMLKGLGNGTAQ